MQWERNSDKNNTVCITISDAVKIFIAETVAHRELMLFSGSHWVDRALKKWKGLGVAI